MTDNIFDASKAKTLTELIETNEKLIKQIQSLREKIKVLEKEKDDFKKERENL